MKRVLSLFLSCVFVLGVCFSTPIVASATDGDENQTENPEILKFDGETTEYQYKVLPAPENNTDKDTCALVQYTGEDDVVITPYEIVADSGNYILTEIAATAFTDGITNTTLTIPANITKIEAGAFSNCTSLTAFEVAEENANYSSDNGVLFDENKTTLVAYPAAKDGEEYTIPEDVKEIATGAFSGAEVTLFSENPDVITNPDGLVIHEVITEGEHTVNGYVVSENDIKSVCSCGVKLETIATIEYIGSCTDNSKNWAKEVKVLVKNGEFVSKNSQDAFSDFVTFTQSDKAEDGSISFYKKQSESAEPVAISVKLNSELDSTAPTGVIKLGEISWDKFLNDITFDLFLKGEQTVTITSADENGSGVKSVGYFVSGEKIEDANLASLEWDSLELDENEKGIVNLKPNSKNIVYAKITDNTGNVNYISSDGIVLYSDSTADTETIEITYKGDVDKEVTVTLNGNEINSVTCDKGEFEISDYTVDSNKITLKGEYLKTLAADEYTYTVSYNPLGVDFVSGTNNNEPATTTFKVIVNKADITGATLPEAITGLVYDGSPKALVSDEKIAEGTVQYRLSENENWSDTVPTGINAGNYTVYYKISLGENYNDITGSIPVNIDRKTIEEASVALEKTFVTYNGQTQIPVVEIQGLTHATDYTVDVVRSDGEMEDFVNVGTFTVTVNGIGNYSGTITKTYEIKKAHLTITAKDVKVIKNSENPALSEFVVGNGLVAGDKVESVQLETTLLNTETVGDYNITVSNAVIKREAVDVTSNYEITYVNGKLSVVLCETHSWKDGVCEVCETACEHIWTDGKCEVCGIVAQHVHSWSFDVVRYENENKISATCTDSNCIYHETGEIFSLIINSNENLVYDNNVKNNPVNIDYSANAQNAFGEEFLNNLSVSYSYNGEPCTVKNAGIYTATLVMGEGDEQVTITKTFEIEPKTINADLLEIYHAYGVKNLDSGLLESNVNVTGFIEGDTKQEKISYSYYRDGKETTDFINVGIITIEVKLNDGNYTFVVEGEPSAEKKLYYQINPAPISEIVIDKIDPETYTGSQIKPKVTVKINGEITALAETEYNVEYGENINAGENAGSVTVVLSKNYNYKGNKEDLTKTFNIKPKEIDVTLEANSDVYNGNHHILQFEFSGVTETFTQGIDYTVECFRGEQSVENLIDVGEIKVVVTLKNNNYIFVSDSVNTTERNLIYTIEKTKVSVTAPTAKTDLVYTGSAQELVNAGSTTFGEIEYRLDNENWSGTIPTATEKGKYTVYYRVQGTENYDGANGSVEVTIKEHQHDWKYSASGAVITATCQNAGCDVKDEIKLEINTPASDYLVYNGEAKQVTYTITEGYEELFKEATISYKGDCVDAGNYTAYVEIGDATARLNFEISKAVIVVTKVTATNRVYNGTLAVEIDKDADIESTGLVSGDKVSFDLSALKGTLADANVGENKVVTITGSIVLTGEDAENYLVSTPKTTTVNITPATLTVTPNAKSSEQYYSLPALDYKVTGLIGSDKLTKEPTLTTNADIKKTGDYTITAAGAEASANYVIKYATAPLTITAHKNHIVKDGTWKETVHGTCMVAGKEAGACTLCGGTVTRDSKTDPNNHALITTVTKLQTCTQNGEALVTCANGCKYSLKTAVPADGKNHDFAEDFTVIASTCVAKGSKYKVCQNPGCKVVSEKTEIAINPDAHKNIVTVNAKDATCETKGYTGDKVCNDCKKTTDPGMEINAKGHTESDWIIDKEPTFTEEGAKHTACTVCKKELKKEVIAKRALETPEVKIENVSNGIKVSWSQDEDATGYTVYSSTYNASTKKWSSWKNRGTAAATKSSWTDKTVTEGVTYRYTVRSVNGTNRSSYKATSGLLYVVAPKVTVSITSTGLLAKWNKVSNATEYVVYRRALVNGTWSSWVVLGTTKAEKNTWSDTSVQSGVTYRYTVRALVGKVRSGYNTSSSIIYLAQPVLEISNVSNGIQGKWSPIAGATGYTIYRSEYNSSTKKWSKWLTLGTTGATAKTFTDKTVKSGYEYKYTIRAVNGKFRSTYQDSNKLVYLAQPTLKISNVANGIQGSWNQVVGATGYIIYRRELKDGKWSNWTSLGTTKATAKTFTDKTVKSGVTYRYTVRATNGVTRSSFASTGSLVFLSVPTVKISSGIKGVNVSWSKIEGATSYLVYRREVANGKWTSWSVITTVTEPTFIDETAKSGTQYRYTVRAVNGSSKSTYTSTSTLNYLAAPTVKLEKLSDSIKVNWTQVTGVTGYTIYRAELGADGKWSKWVTLGTATNKYSSCKDKTAKTGVTYKYTVRAVNGKVKSAYIDGTQITNQ